MDHYTVFPDSKIFSAGLISGHFLSLGIDRVHSACGYVHQLPYGYNTDRDDIMILFKENMGSCTTKHSVIATLAEELGLPIFKSIGIYAMTGDIVAGAGEISEKFGLPYIPMLHCFLEYDQYRIDLTQGNHNGKKRAIENFLFTRQVAPNISGNEEYLLYRQVLKDLISERQELHSFKMVEILKAREEGIKLLKFNLKQ